MQLCGLLDKYGNIYSLDIHSDISQKEITTIKSCTSKHLYFDFIKYLKICLVLFEANVCNNDDLFDIFNTMYYYIYRRRDKLNQKIQTLADFNTWILKNCKIEKERIVNFIHTSVCSTKPEFYSEVNIEKIKTGLEWLKELYDQNFLRLRFGRLYSIINRDTSELYIRIASTNFNWFDIVWNFVYKNKDNISNITIVRDNFALGYEGIYKINNQFIDHMSLNDFIMLPGNPELNENYTLMSPTQFRDKLRNFF